MKSLLQRICGNILLGVMICVCTVYTTRLSQSWMLRDSQGLQREKIPGIYMREWRFRKILQLTKSWSWTADMLAAASLAVNEFKVFHFQSHFQSRF